MKGNGMVRRVGIAALVILGIVLSGVQAIRPSAAQSSPPSATLADLPGTSTLLAAVGEAKLSVVANPHLRLERIDIPGGSALSDHVAAGPELLAVISGAVDVADNFGFANAYATGSNATIAAATVYSLSNSATTAASVYRVSVAGDEAPTAASPAGGTPVSPAVVKSSVLIDAKIPKLSRSRSTIFLMELSWRAGASSGRLDHTGPIGVYVEKGSLAIVSPSGITGNVAAGAGVMLPATAPLIASNSGGGESIAVIFGVSSSPDALLSPFVPTPTKTSSVPPSVIATVTATPSK